MSSITINVDFEALRQWHESDEYKEQKRKEKALQEKLDGKEFEINGYIVKANGITLKTETIVDGTKITSGVFLYYGNKEVGYNIYYPTRILNYGNINKLPKKFQEACIGMRDALESLRKFD